MKEEKRNKRIWLYSLFSSLDTYFGRASFSPRMTLEDERKGGVKEEGRGKERKGKGNLLGHVEVEEICVKQRLDGPRNPHNPINITLSVVAVNPVDEIQGAVKSQRR